MYINPEKRISAKPILEYYHKLEERNIESHGLIVLHKGEVAFEHYVKPYSAEIPHSMFSITKSVVSTAVGFAIEEELFALDDKVIDFFPEYEACESDEWNNVTVRSLLTMQSNKVFSFTQDMTGNYVEMFMKAPFRKEKRGFLYSNNDAHVVAAIVQKKAGMDLIRYLTPRLFEPLGIKASFWEGNCINELVGGTGCYMTLRDLVKLGQCYADAGRWNGKQIIPEWWTEEATKIQVRFGNKAEEGYGYLFWIHKGGYSMTGMYGQQVTCFPQKDLVMASFNCCLNDGDFSRAFENVLPKAFEEEPDKEYDKKLIDYLESIDEKIIPCKNLPQIPIGKTFRISVVSKVVADLIFPASVIPRSVNCSMAKRPMKSLTDLSFEVNKDVLLITWYEDGDKVVIRCGLDGEARVSEITLKGYPFTLWAYAYVQNSRLNVVVKPVNTLSTTFLSFEFCKGKVKMQIKGTPDFVEFIMKNAEQSDFVRNSGSLKPLVKKTVSTALNMLNLPIVFK